jgi:hypothetical protein
VEGVSRRSLRLTLSRDELVDILYALEYLRDGYIEEGGLSLIDRELRLKEKLDVILYDFDLRGARKVQAVTLRKPTRRHQHGDTP